MQTALTKPKFKLIFFFCMIVLFSSVSLIATNAAFLFTNNIYHGVSIGNVPVGGLSIDEAKDAIQAAFTEQRLQSVITVQHEKNTWSISAQDIELAINADDLAAKAHDIGRSGNIIKILQERYVTANGGYTVPFTQHYNHTNLYNIITEIARSINKNPQNAFLTYNNKTMEIIPEVLGQEVDIPLTLDAIAKELTTTMQFTSHLIVNQKAPEINSRDFNEINALLAVYTTEFDQSKKNRYENVDIASKRIDNRLVHSNEIFSFNDNVGLRLPEYGYKEAPVFIDGKLTLDWGGGVCQVSTTLYNAVLLADMAIEERTSHFQPPGYVPLGQDAAVADNLLDFKFKNTSAHNIYIKSEVYNGRITIFIFGKDIPNPSEIRIESDSNTLEYRTIIKQDPSLPLGKSIVESAGQKGFEVTAYRVKKLNGNEISRERLSSDEFKAEDRIIRVGTKSQATPK